MSQIKPLPPVDIPPIVQEITAFQRKLIEALAYVEPAKNSKATKPE